MSSAYAGRMPTACQNGRCPAPLWMRLVLGAAGLHQIALGAWLIFRAGAPPPAPVPASAWPWLAAGMAGIGCGLLLSARDPMRHWKFILLGFLKFSLVLAASVLALVQQKIAAPDLWVPLLDSALWWPLFASILWACLRVQVGIPLTRAESYTVAEAAQIYRLSSGQTLEDASTEKLLVLVFLRHFGCTFTRRILRGLEEIQVEATRRGAELVLVHMLRSGDEISYLGKNSSIARIADPRCELYRAFGLGKGGVIALFGPQVWLRGVASLMQGCGVGHLAGDGLQMPGAFLFRHGAILSAQPARTAADLPDIPALFRELPPEGSAS
jgi:hypothetical protein